MWIAVISKTWWKEKTRPQWGGVAANRNLRSEAGRKGSGQSCRNDRVMRAERGRVSSAQLEGFAWGRKEISL